MINVRKKYYEETGESWINSQDEPDIDYVTWLESRINKMETVLKSLRDNLTTNGSHYRTLADEFIELPK